MCFLHFSVKGLQFLLEKRDDWCCLLSAASCLERGNGVIRHTYDPREAAVT
jgi:hypothetical protein